MAHISLISMISVIMSGRWNRILRLLIVVYSPFSTVRVRSINSSWNFFAQILQVMFFRPFSLSLILKTIGRIQVMYN